VKVRYAIAVAGLPLATTGLAPASQAAQPRGQVVVIQAVPDTIDTGSAAVAEDASVTPFSTPGRPADTGWSGDFSWLTAALGAILVTVTPLGTRRIRVQAIATKPVEGRSGPPAR
jgi:hypothetical protein